MEESRNTDTAAAAESVIDSIKRLLEAVGNDEELKRKLEEALTVLTGKTFEREDAPETGNPPEPETPGEDPDDDEEEEAEEDDDDDTEGEIVCPDPDLADIFNEDAIAGMVVGFVAGAAVVGGGVLLHKVLSK